MSATATEAIPRSSTRLSGRRLVRARAAWGALFGIMLGLYLVLLPDYWAQLHTVCTGAGCATVQPSPASAHILHQLGLSVAVFATWTFAFTIATSLICLAVGGVIVWRRSDDWMALVVALTEVSLATQYVTSALAQGGQTAWRVPATLLNILGSTTLFLLFALFPSGRFVPPWLRWLLVAWGICGVALLIWHDVPGAFTLYSLAWLGPAFVEGSAQVYRYQRFSTRAERQQTKWVVLGAVVAGALAISLIVPVMLVPAFRQPGSFYQLASGPGYMLAIVVLSVAVGLAILRSHLFDIDVIIRRTLIYGSLSACLAAVYFAVVIGAQALLEGLTHQTRPQPVIIVATTLLIAALFTPLRRRIQQVIDLRCYRRKYDAAKTLAAFGTTLRTETNLTDLSDQLVAVVEETMQPAHVSLWLSPLRRASRSD